MVVNPACGQLNRNTLLIFTLPESTRKTRWAPLLHPAFRDGIYDNSPIEPVPSFHRITQLRAEGVYYRESLSTGSVIVMAARLPDTACVKSQIHVCPPLPTTTTGTVSGHVHRNGACRFACTGRGVHQVHTNYSMKSLPIPLVVKMTRGVTEANVLISMLSRRERLLSSKAGNHDQFTE